MIETIHQGLKEEGISGSISQLCQWFGVPRRTFYYRSVRPAPKVQERFAGPIKA
ncbi:helix-turn-helix domain-containing protein [Methylocaldum sp.]|uniref:helix-turn-helix domain-containing protein n=1 Tax=Methylocaldum sp. TaxID=1969727 RepID=UPI002D31CAE0|nr:helix-turn-helix domain-containing protein [Methylocaldum sp.]HYE35623.1 helix-turn-helix domain-containing protein [Methylocaldum sp.]